MTDRVGTGRYSWVGLDGRLHEATHWDDLPDRMDWLVAFVPDYPKPPHTEDDHALMATFDDRLHEALARCRR